MEGNSFKFDVNENYSEGYSCIKFSIHGNIPPKKNSKQIFVNSKTGRPFITASKGYKKWSQEQQLILKTSVKFCLNDVHSISLNFHFKTKRRCDLTNKAESVMDLLTDIGLIADDCWQVVPKLKLFGEKDDKDICHIGIIYKKERER